MPYRVVFAPEARDDLLERIEAYCRSFVDFPERGTPRDDIFPGLRLVGFERRVTIAFHISGNTVTFDRVLYGGRELGKFADDL